MIINLDALVSSSAYHCCNRGEKISTISRGASAIEQMFGTGKKKKSKKKKTS